MNYMAGLIRKQHLDAYLHYFQTAGDFLIINLAFLTAFVFPHALDGGELRTAWILCNAAYLPLAYRGAGGLRSRALHIDRLIASTLRSLIVHALIFISALYFVGIDSLPPSVFLLFYLICFLVFPLWRTAGRLILKHLRSKGRNFRNVAIIGTNPTATRLFDTFCTDAGLGYRVVGFFDDTPSQELASAGLYRGSISDLEQMMREPVDEIFFTLSADSGNEESAFIRATRLADRHGVAFYYVPQMSRFLPRGFELMEFGSVPVLSLRHNPLSSSLNRSAKRALDIAVASVALLLSPVVLLPAAIAIKLTSPGPLFFRQKRTGYLGSEFECIKLRTMRVNDKADTLQASHDDPRTTAVGAFLRRTSLDEVPQFWNVLRGEMSVVGPRPHMLTHSAQYSELIDRYRARHIVKPGITGWAQVNGLRGETRQLWQMEKRVEYDVFYIENWTILFDIKIICRTILNSLHTDRNAF